MSHAEKCPVCGGTGQVSNRGIDTPTTETSHACNGRGWIVVEDNETAD